MSGGGRRVRATFWLLEAPDSLARQSRREPDGTGVGWYDERGRPAIAKQPVAAYEDHAFAREARELESTAFVAHIRYATTGAVRAVNTHPFAQHGRLFAHNGVVHDLPRLERELSADSSLVRGDTDSERVFALITRETKRHDGDVGAGISFAARWIAANLPVYALNLVVASRDELWALRYPDVHELWVLRRDAGGARGDRHLDAVGAAGTVHVHSEHLARHPSLIVASEPMDTDPGWRLLVSGELLHVDAKLHVHSTIAVPEPPAHPLSLQDLEPRAAAAQAPVSGGRPPAARAPE
jgi:predicted glutamine amidotransferase